MDSVTRVTVDAPLLARTLANVNAFCMARSQYPVVRMTIEGNRLAVCASDTYTVGSDYVECETYGIWQGILTREQSGAVEKAARSERKALITLSLGVDDPQGGLPLRFNSDLGGDDVIPPMRVRYAEGQESDLFRMLDDMLADMAEQPEVDPYKFYQDGPAEIYFQPGLLAPFSKVRPAGEAAVMGMRIFFTEKPVYVKIGPTFRGAIMPVIPDKAEPQNREEMLW